MKQIRCCKCGEIMNVEDAYSNLTVNGAVGHKECVLTYVEEQQKPELVKLVIGDWSDDGHGKYKEIYYSSNYPVETIQQAYRDSCKLTGVQFNINDDYTGGLCKSWGTWRHMLCEYEDSHLRLEAVDILRENGLDPALYCDEKCSEEDLKNYGGMPFDSDSAADLIMAFMALSMPKDWKYEKQENDAKAINGWWGKLNQQFGYGLFY